MIQLILQVFALLLLSGELSIEPGEVYSRVPESCVGTIYFRNFERLRRQYQDLPEITDEYQLILNKTLPFIPKEEVVWLLSYSSLSIKDYKHASNSGRDVEKEFSNKPLRTFDRVRVYILQLYDRFPVQAKLEASERSAENYRQYTIWTVDYSDQNKGREEWQIAFSDDSTCFISKDPKALRLALDCNDGIVTALVDNALYMEIFAHIESEDDWSLSLQKLRYDARIPCMSIRNTYQQQRAEETTADGWLYQLDQRYYEEEIRHVTLLAFSNEEQLQEFQELSAGSRVSFPDDMSTNLKQAIVKMADFDSLKIEDNMIIKSRIISLEEIRQRSAAREMLDTWKEKQEQKDK